MLSGKHEANMDTQARINQHRDRIAHLREDAAWIKDTAFSLSAKPGETTDDLIAHINGLIQMYERFVDRLEGD